MARQRILVIGGGLAGPVTALFLAKAGCEVRVFEAYSGPPPGGGALTVAPNGMFVLGELGLADRVVAAGTTIARIDFTTSHGRRLGSLNYGPAGLYRFPAVSLARAAVHRMLLDGLAASAIPICYGKRLARIEQDERGVTAYFSDGTVASGDVLVGADGIRSTVRQWILPNAPEPSFTGLIGAGGFLPRSTMLRLVGAENEHTMALCYGNRAFVGYALGDQREEMGAYWWHALAREKPPSAAERHALSGEQGVDALLKVDGGWSETVRAILTATTTHIPPLDLFDVPGLRRWSAGRVVLVGDAAHAVSPHSGQGASMALEDSIVLARQLTHRDVSLEAALDAYEDARRPRAERVVAMGRRSGNQKRRGPFSSALQMLLMPLVLRLMPAPHWLYGHEEAWT